MVDARSEPEYEPRAHTTTRRLMVTLAARRFSKVRPYSYADARLETRHAQLVPDLPLRLCGAWLTRGPGRILTRRPQGTPSFMLLAAARAMGRLRIVRNLPNIGSLIRLRVAWRSPVTGHGEIQDHHFLVWSFAGGGGRTETGGLPIPTPEKRIVITIIDR